MKQGLFQKKSMVARSAAGGENWGSARVKTVWGEALVCVRVCVRVCVCARVRARVCVKTYSILHQLYNNNTDT